MGGSASAFNIHRDVDSPTTPGEKSIVTDAIEGIEVGQLTEAMEKAVRDGKTKVGPETSLDITDKDGGIFLHHRFTIPALFGGGEVDMYNMYKFDMAKGEMTVDCYTSTKKLERNEPNATSNFRVLQDPVRIEFFVNNHETRMHGKLMKHDMDRLLGKLGATATAEYDQPSPSDPGQLCVLSAPIEGAPFDADSYLDAYTAYKCDSEGATMLPDGTFVEETAMDFDVLGITAKAYNKQVVCKEENSLYIYEYGTDENLETILGVRQVKVLKDPFRLEVHAIQKPRRVAGDPELQVVKPFIMEVLKSLQEASS